MKNFNLHVSLEDNKSNFTSKSKDRVLQTLRRTDRCGGPYDYDDQKSGVNLIILPPRTRIVIESALVGSQDEYLKVRVA